MFTVRWNSLRSRIVCRPSCKNENGRWCDEWSTENTAVKRKCSITSDSISSRIAVPQRKEGGSRRLAPRVPPGFVDISRPSAVESKKKKIASRQTWTLWRDRFATNCAPICKVLTLFCYCCVFFFFFFVPPFPLFRWLFSRLLSLDLYISLLFRLIVFSDRRPLVFEPKSFWLLLLLVSTFSSACDFISDFDRDR